MSKAFIELEGVAKTFSLESGVELRVLDGLTLTISEGEFVALLGPSGSGKSTCLRIMCGLTPASAGHVLTHGSGLVGINRDVSMVFQSFALFPWETVYQNLALALEAHQLPRSEIRERVKRTIDLVGLEGFEEAYPRELSGGMKQRVGIARALVMERPVLFLDEPFSALDVLTADTLRTEVMKIFLDKKTATRAVVLVTHNIQEAVSMARRILVMGAHPGHIRKEVINDLPYPRDEQSPAFLRMVSQIHALITEALMPDVSAGEEQGRLQKMPKKVPPIETLPRAQINEMIGLLGAISDRGGSADIFELAHEIRRDFGSTLYLVKAAELFDLVDTPKQMVELTALGGHFVRGDINVRKRMLNELFGGLRFVQLTTNLLKQAPNLRVPLDELTDHVAGWLPNENPHEQVETLISWGRFAEYLGYSDDTRQVYLDVGQEAEG